MDKHNEIDWRPLLEPWRNVALGSTRMHYEAQRHFSRRERLLGGLATLLTALVGATVVKEIGGASTDPRVRWGIGAAAALATILTSLHTFLGFAARTASHRSTAAGYAAVLRRIDEELTFGRASLEDQRRVSESIRTNLDALSRDAPEVPAHILARYRKPSVALPPTVPAGTKDGVTTFHGVT
ncbi:MAG TPA: SLATT domain-containing protein [Longimicrobiaceae bacterium]|nr:SLATT domain-containing protein [Longimicrobiaceae bacterium]